MNTGLEQSVTTVERQSGRPQRYFRGVNVNEGRLEMEEEKKKQRMKKGEREKKKENVASHRQVRLRPILFFFL